MTESALIIFELLRMTDPESKMMVATYEEIDSLSRILQKTRVYPRPSIYWSDSQILIQKGHSIRHNFSI